MKQCENCINKEYKDKLVCCAANELFEAFENLFKHVPVLGKFVAEYECRAYEDERLWSAHPSVKK